MSYNDKTSRSKGRETAAGEHEVRELLQGAGRRQPIPPESHARLDSAARSAWEEMVNAEKPALHRSRLPRIAAMAAALVIAVLAGWVWVANQGDPAIGRVATIELEVGTEAVGSMHPRGDATFDIAVGDELAAGVRLITAGGDGGAEGRLALRMAGGEAIRLDAGSKVRLVSSSRLELEAGGVYVDSESAASSREPLEISTPFGIVHHVGTQYEVRLEDAAAMLVRVREGSVSVRNNGDSWAAGKGEELTLLSDGSVSRGTVTAGAWLWTLAAAPAVRIEGMTLGEYLGWVADETGWRVEYEDEALAASAAGIVLQGTIEVQRPDEWVGYLVESSGLAHRVEDGVLYIKRP